MELTELENDYLWVKFRTVDDYKCTKYEGPWMVMDHYLIVKEWIPNFDPFKDNIKKEIVWIQFP